MLSHYMSSKITFLLHVFAHICHRFRHRIFKALPHKICFFLNTWSSAAACLQVWKDSLLFVKQSLPAPRRQNMIYLWPFKRKCHISTYDKVKTRVADRLSLHTGKNSKKNKTPVVQYNAQKKLISHRSFSLIY